MAKTLKRRQLFGRFAPLTAAVVIGAACLVSPARADDVAPTPKIAIANPENIAKSIKETQDLNGKMEMDRKALQNKAQDMQTNLTALKQKLGYLHSDAPQYQDVQDQLLKASIEYDVWVKEQDLDMQRKIKAQTKALFLEIQNAVAVIAQQKGYNLVIADQRPDIPDNMENMDVPTLLRIISQRTILYSDQKFDIDGAVITYLDQQYNNRNQPH